MKCDVYINVNLTELFSFTIRSQSLLRTRCGLKGSELLTNWQDVHLNDISLGAIGRRIMIKDPQSSNQLKIHLGCDFFWVQKSFLGNAKDQNDFWRPQKVFFGTQKMFLTFSVVKRVSSIVKIMFDILEGQKRPSATQKAAARTLARIFFCFFFFLTRKKSRTQHKIEIPLLAQTSMVEL